MSRNRLISYAAAIVVCMLSASIVNAETFNLTVTPGMVPDAQTPRIAGDAPTVQFGSDSWMNSTTGKVNVYVTPEQLFGASKAVGDIASISYWTKAPTGNENWYINIYTKPETGGDASWYGQRFFNSDYTSYASDGLWHEHTLGEITRSSGIGGSFATLSDWKTAYANKAILAFSPQTNSGIPLNARDAQIDGMTITLNNGDIGNVNFAAAAVVPLPPAALAGVGLIGLLAAKRRLSARNRT